MKAIQIVWQILPLVQELIGTMGKHSAGGKQITKEERKILITSTVSAIGLILEENL